MQVVVRNETGNPGYPTAQSVILPGVFANTVLAPNATYTNTSYTSISEKDLKDLVSLAIAGKISFPGNGSSIDRGLPVKPTNVYVLNGQEPLMASDGDRVYSIDDSQFRSLISGQWVTDGADYWTVKSRNYKSGLSRNHITKKGQLLSTCISDFDTNDFFTYQPTNQVSEVFGPREWATLPNASFSPGSILGLTVNLGDGTILMCGGYGAGFALTDTAYIYDPKTDTRTATDTMPYKFAAPQATSAVMMANGKALIAGVWWDYGNSNQGGFVFVGGSGNPGDTDGITLAVSGGVVTVSITDPWLGGDFTYNGNDILVGQQIEVNGCDSTANDGVFMILSVATDLKSFTYANSAAVNDSSNHGFIGIWPGVHNKRVLCYNPKAAPGSKWSLLADMRNGAGNCALVAMDDGRVMAVGGTPGQGSTTARFLGQVYNPTTNAWTLTSQYTTTVDAYFEFNGLFDAPTDSIPAADLLPSFQHAGCDQLSDGRILIAGGRAVTKFDYTEGIKSSIVAYTPGHTIVDNTFTDDSWEDVGVLRPEPIDIDEAIASWEEAPSPFPTPNSSAREYVTVVADDHKGAYIIGGQNFVSGNSVAVDYFDGKRDTLTQMADLPVRKNSDGSAVFIGQSFGFSFLPNGLISLNYGNKAAILQDGSIVVTHCGARDPSNDLTGVIDSGLETAIYTPGKQFMKRQHKCNRDRRHDRQMATKCTRKDPKTKGLKDLRLFRR